MSSTKKDSEPLKDLTQEQIAQLVKSNDDLDQEQARIIREETEEEERKRSEPKNKSIKRLRKSPFEIINRTLFFIFLGSLIFSFVSFYKYNTWWFLLYLTSAFSCILYTPNRKALKELIDAWPNIVELIKGLRK